MLAASLAAVILLGYTGSLWWLLRRESAATLAAIIGLCGICLALRVVESGRFPAGLNHDEVKNLSCSVPALERGELFSESCNGPPFLLSVLFEAPLVPLLGPGRWTIRTYSLVTSVLSVPAAFALARALGLGAAASLAVGGLIAVLPWSIFYGRISLGGELLFHELLLLTALARLVWAGGGLVEVAIGMLGLSLLLYDYFSGRAMVGMPLVATVLARGWRRAACLAIVALALLSWIPHLRTGPAYAKIGFSKSGMHQDFEERPLHALKNRTLATLRTLRDAVGKDGLFTIPGISMHPWMVFALASVGALTGIRRGLFLLAGFISGILPAVLSYGDAPSGHRMMMAFPFIALAAGCAFDLIPGRRWGAVVAAATVLVVGVKSVQLYFSEDFWRRSSGFDWERTALLEALVPPRQRLIAMNQWIPYLGAWALIGGHERGGPGVALLTAANWLPPNGQPTTYVFTSDAGPLQAFYVNLFGSRVKSFGGSFTVQFEARDWSWLRQHGWLYEVRCGDLVKRHQVPTLAHAQMPISEERECVGMATTHVWRGHWNGPTSTLLFTFTGDALIETPKGQVRGKGFEKRVSFQVDADSDVTVTLVTPPEVYLVLAALTKATPGGEVVPPWDDVTPIFPEE